MRRHFLAPAIAALLSGTAGAAPKPLVDKAGREVCEHAEHCTSNFCEVHRFEATLKKGTNRLLFKVAARGRSQLLVRIQDEPKGSIRISAGG